MSPILGIWASQNYSRYSLPTSFESIATTTVGAGGASTVTFSSIPATYAHLQVRWIGRASNNGFNDSTLFIRFNNDTTTVYWNHYLLGDGSSASAGNQSNTGKMNIGQTVTTNVASNIFAVGVMDVLDYANANKNKTVRNLLGFDTNGAGKAALFSGSWSSTSAIDQITIFSGSSQFEQYSHFALYGIKGE